MALRVVRLGRLSWGKALEKQLQSVKNYEQDTLLLVEHPPTYTCGRRMQFTDAERHRLESLGADVYDAGRGGQVTFHGPGQLVGYPIFNVFNHGGVRCFVHKVESALIQTCASFNLVGKRSPHTGVWVGDNKIAAIGVQVQKGITYHGFALNCDADLTWFSNIVPCGIVDKGVTSLSKELHLEVTIQAAEQPIVQSFIDVFGFSAHTNQDTYTSNENSINQLGG